MLLLKDLELVNNDWVRCEDDWAQQDENTPIIVSFQCLLADWSKLKQRSGKLGVEFSNIENASALEMFLDRLDVITLPFPSFTDGRAFSLATAIRRLGYQGELRASGYVLPDQLIFMHQVGFDAVEISARFAPETWQKAAAAITLGYQQNRGIELRNIWVERNDDHPDFIEQPHAG